MKIVRNLRLPTLQGFLLLALSAGSGACAGTPELVFANDEGDASVTDAASRPLPGSAADAGDARSTGAPTPHDDAGAVAADAAAASAPSTPAPPATCPTHVPAGADACCGAVPCVGKKCHDSCGACAVCAGRVCCVGSNQNNDNGNGNGTSASCERTPGDCADPP